MNCVYTAETEVHATKKILKESQKYKNYSLEENITYNTYGSKLGW